MTDKLQDRLCYPPRLMAVERASTYVSFGTTKFQEMVADGRMPQPIYIDGSPRWDRFELDASVENLKDGRGDPIKRSRDKLENRLREQERQ